MKQATEKQVAFIHKLVGERQIPWGTRGLTEPEVAAMDVKQASGMIEFLLAMPRRTVVLDYGKFNQQVAGLPNSKYALETAALLPYLVSENVSGDLLFVEVREFKGRKYVRRLHGAPGSFTRTRFSVEDGLQVVSAIAANPAAAALAFSVAYTCCACCLAPLTDEESRARGMGPICAKRFA